MGCRNFRQPLQFMKGANKMKKTGICFFAAAFTLLLMLSANVSAQSFSDVNKVSAELPTGIGDNEIRIKKIDLNNNSSDMPKLKILVTGDSLLLMRNK